MNYKEAGATSVPQVEWAHDSGLCQKKNPQTLSQSFVQSLIKAPIPT